MNAQDQLLEALHAATPAESLREIVRSLLAQGHGRRSVCEELEKLRGALQGDGREADDDVVLDVMDLLTGWCRPEARI